ncbi:MAG: MFS transporter [Gammaproteobacteria bacterium]|nr:MFS transporter [Gammaproteobacteria bacterium]
MSILHYAAGIKTRHYVTYLIAVLISSGYAGSIAVMQPALLTIIGVPAEEQGSVTGMLAALQEVILIVLLGLVGAMSDRIGRKAVYAFGFLATSLGFYLYPHAVSVSELFVYRAIIAVGTAAMLGMMVTVVADYCTNETRGKANGFQGAVATVGAAIPMVFATLPQVFVGQGQTQIQAQHSTYGVAAAMGILGAVVVLIGLAAKSTQPMAGRRESFAHIVSEGFKAVRDKGVALSYGAAFISRGDLAVTGAFLNLWLIQYGTTRLGLSLSEAMAQLAFPAIGFILLGAIVGSIVMGIFADIISKAAAVTTASGLAAAVYMSMFFVSDPTVGWVKGLLFVMGVAEISAFVSSQALVGQQAEPHHRGTTIGFFGVAGAIGILVATTGGGVVFDAIGPSAPFVIFGTLNLVVFLWGLAVFKQIRVPSWSTSSQSL